MAIPESTEMLGLSLLQRPCMSRIWGDCDNDADSHLLMAIKSMYSYLVFCILFNSIMWKPFSVRMVTARLCIVATFVLSLLYLNRISRHSFCRLAIVLETASSLRARFGVSFLFQKQFFMNTSQFVPGNPTSLVF